MIFVDVGAEKSVFANGIHDDTKALQMCIDRAREGGTVFFPDGTYLVSASLIFYSNQRLVFSDEARLLRSAEGERITRYILSSYSEPDVDGYDGTHDVEIIGGIFDGNAQTDEFLTILNTVHCRNITVKNCRFVHGAGWHCIEFNSTDGILVSGCAFDGGSYTRMRPDLSNELIQTDAPDVNSYGPVYDWEWKLIAHKLGKTPCRNVTIEHCLFKCAGFPAIGHHGNHNHENIVIRNNIFYGRSCADGKSRGYITFMPHVSGVQVYGNTFVSDADEGDGNKLFEVKNQTPGAWEIGENAYYGAFDDRPAE